MMYVPSVSNKLKNFGETNNFMLASWSIFQWFGSADPDPYQNVANPEHCRKEYGILIKEENKHFLNPPSQAVID